MLPRTRSIAVSKKQLHKHQTTEGGFILIIPKSCLDKRGHYNKHPLKYIDPETLASAFMHCEERKVDKSGCISFEGRKYEVGLNFIGCKVSVIYDPTDTSELTIEYESHEPFRVRQMVIGEQSGKRPRLPEHLLPEPADSSRLLSAAAKKNQERTKPPIPVVSYRKVRKEGEDNV